MGKATTIVEGIVPTVSFSPNGSEEWKKQHTTKVTVEETEETITGMQYLWVKDDGVNEPEVTAFKENCPNDGVIIGGDDTMIGEYYLWVLLNMGTGSNQKTSISVSGAFNFDNELPTVSLESLPVSENSFTLTATASDTKSGIAKYEFYVDNVKVYTKETTEGTMTYTWSGAEMEENKQCYVIVIDKASNNDIVSINAATKLHHWKMYPVITRRGYSWEKPDSSSINSVYSPINYWDHMPEMDPDTGKLEPYTGSKKVGSLSMYKDYILYNGNCVRESGCHLAEGYQYWSL